jgi:hypothetical protein
MNAVMGHHEVVVTNPTAQDAAGATIGRQTDVWIPCCPPRSRRDHGWLRKWRRCENYEMEAAVKVLWRESPFEFVD